LVSYSMSNTAGNFKLFMPTYSLPFNLNLFHQKILVV
jgi:hypothetical protein